MEKEHHLPSYLWKGYVGSRWVNYQKALNETVETSRTGATRLFALGRLPLRVEPGWMATFPEKKTTTFCFKEMPQVGSSFRSWSEVNDLNFVLRIKLFDFKWLSSNVNILKSASFITFQIATLVVYFLWFWSSYQSEMIFCSTSYLSFPDCIQIALLTFGNNWVDDSWWWCELASLRITLMWSITCRHLKFLDLERDGKRFRWFFLVFFARKGTEAVFCWGLILREFWRSKSFFEIWETVSQGFFLCIYI